MKEMEGVSKSTKITGKKYGSCF